MSKRALDIVVMHRGNPAAWVLVPEFLERIRAFQFRYDGGAFADRLQHIFMSDFGVGLGKTFGLAVIDIEDPSAIRAHLFGSIETWLLEPIAVCHQWEKTNLEPDTELDERCQALFDGWAQAKGARFMRAFALDEARVRVLHRLGWRPGARMILKEHNNG